MKYFLLVLAFCLSLFSTEFKKPIHSFTTSGYVIDLVYKDGRIYASTNAGVLDIFDYKTKKLINKITVPDVKDFMGDNISSKIFSVDVIDKNIMMLSKSKNGYNRVHIVKDGKKELVIDYQMELAIIKAKYLDKNTLLLALLSNELISFDINKKKENYRVQVNGAKFSDFALNEDKSKVVVTDESGDVTIINTKDGKTLDVLSGQNLDNVFQISYKNGVIATAGQDRRVAIYVPKYKSAYHKMIHFLVYSVGLSLNGKYVCYSSDEENNLVVMDTVTKSEIAHFGDNKATITDIEFIDNNIFLASSNSTTLNLFKIK
jgi:hypothetical protein